jgi:diguanylate cyclase (GGDEF)-like protein
MWADGVRRYPFALRDGLMRTFSESTNRSVGKLTIVIMLAALYGVMYLLLYPHMSYGGAPFAAITAIAAGWFFGIRGGLVTSLFVGIENLLLYHFTIGHTWYSTFAHGNVAGMISLILIAGATGHMSDLSDKVKAYAQLLQHEAFHDSLTNLPNRALFYDRLEHAMARVTRGTNSIALLFLDLDGFKQINDRHGHVVGDKLLAAVAERLQSKLRLGDTVARLGGDEFVILLEDIVDLNASEQAATRLARELELPYSIEGTEVAITASIGIAFRAAGEPFSEDLLLDSDRAMYQAKAAGKARCQVAQSNQPRTPQPTIGPIIAMGD